MNRWEEVCCISAIKLLPGSTSAEQRILLYVGIDLPLLLIWHGASWDNIWWNPKTIWNKGGCKLFWLFLFHSLFFKAPFLYCYSVLNVHQCMKGTHCSNDNALLHSAFCANTVQSVQEQLFWSFWYVTLKIESHAIKKCVLAAFSEVYPLQVKTTNHEA